MLNSSVSGTGNLSVAVVKNIIWEGVNERVQCTSKIEDQSLTILRDQFYF